MTALADYRFTRSPLCCVGRSVRKLPNYVSSVSRPWSNTRNHRTTEPPNRPQRFERPLPVRV